MDEEEIQTLTKENEELKRQLIEARASRASAMYFAGHFIEKCSTTNLKGSGIIVEIQGIGKKTVYSDMDPVFFAGGFSDDTIACLLKDLKRSFDYLTEFKPQLAYKKKEKSNA